MFPKKDCLIETFELAREFICGNILNEKQSIENFLQTFES